MAKEVSERDWLALLVLGHHTSDICWGVELFPFPVLGDRIPQLLLHLRVCDVREVLMGKQC